MTKKDTDNLFALLEIYFPNSQKTKDRRLHSAWALLLEPYSPECVKAALLEHMRESKYFPDPQAIAVLCQNRDRRQKGIRAGAEEPTTEKINAFGEWIDQFLDEHDPDWRTQWG